jgi:hypothetical protein
LRIHYFQNLKFKIITYSFKPEIKERRNILQNQRRKYDVRIALRGNISSRISHALKSINSSKNSTKTVEYLDCSIDFFKTHLENQFTDGMRWDNYGTSSGNAFWEIDHITPIHYENPTLEDVKERLHYTNCQPMWAEENRSKGNRFIG